MPLLSIAVAVAENGVIGRDNALPWHLPDDLKWFKRITLGKPVVMGRRTFESIGRPLPGRPNVVVTSDRDWKAEGVHVAHGFADALDRAAGLVGDYDEVVVIGGARLFADALERADRLYLTEVHSAPEGDVVFPRFDRRRWREVERIPGAPAAVPAVAPEAAPEAAPAVDGATTHTFVILERIAD